MSKKTKKGETTPFSNHVLHGPNSTLLCTLFFLAGMQKIEIASKAVPYTNRIWPGLTEFGPPMWQAEADTELTLSAASATAVGQILLTLAKFC